MAWPEKLPPMSLPLIGAPMFVISSPGLVIAQCINGVIGAFPALNARPQPVLGEWLATITAALETFRQRHPGAEIAPIAVNQIIHASNDRLARDLDLCERFKVPVIITSLSAPDKVVSRVHAWGGIVFHDVINPRHAKKAIDAGADGVILVCAGGGGHAGTLSPFALVEEVRKFWPGAIVLAGAIATGRGVLAARAMGADLAYAGTRFIATQEANASLAYKEAIVAGSANDIVYSAYFTGVPGNYLRHSIIAAGLDPDSLGPRETQAMDFAARKSAQAAKAWRDIWGAGQGVGSVSAILPAAEVIKQMRAEYESARQELCEAAAAPALLAGLQ
ncbi:MAG: nitronate monooxygenase [Methylocapsa sp.]|nr:nitronate monooxygenase [Methylocapsa sp.]